MESFVEYVRTEAAIDHPREKIRAVLSGLAQIVGEDEIENARDQLPPEYGHLFEGPGQLEEVSDLAAEWFVEHLG